MMDLQPLLLREAVLSLYPADTEGNAVVAAPVWCGACANGLKLGLTWEEGLSFSSGDRFKTAHHNDEQHSIDVQRTWLIRQVNPGEPAGPQRGGRYVLEIIWHDAHTRYWYRRVYYGVTGRSSDLESEGAKHHNNPQSFRAQYFTTDGGRGTAGAFTPVTSYNGEQLVGFFGENPLLVDTYLLGHYRWSALKRITGVRYACWPPAATTVLTLELDGVLTADTLTLAAGTPNTDVKGALDFSRTVPAGTEVRWKVTSGPGAEDAAWHVGLVMTVVDA